ncbi:MAG: acyl-CoA dehydratase activase [Firmicutes bacterium]|nr:acyl-CoA dehydratase activase [Bacillota bacterium]
MRVYLGIDVGSVSTDVAVIDDDNRLVAGAYLMTRGQPIGAVQEALQAVSDCSQRGMVVCGAGATGSGRYLAAAIMGADAVKNEITAHAVAAIDRVPGVSTVIEIGGQDSKIIIIRDGVVVDFAMNSVCAAGTGSFLDRQAARLGIPIEEFGRVALCSSRPTRIAGRCAVFAESDMVHKQQVGHAVEDIVWGLCQALVRNYLSNVGKGKDIRPPVAFQGGVAANAGMKRGFEEALGYEVVVPEEHKLMGAIGAAILAREACCGKTAFRGFGVTHERFVSRGFECDGCANSCEVTEIHSGGSTLARWGGRCGRWACAKPAVPWRAGSVV